MSSWVLLLLIAFSSFAHGQVLQDAPFRRWEDFPKLDSVCLQKGVSSVLMLQNEDGKAPLLHYQEFDRNGRRLTNLDQIGGNFQSFEYPAPQVVFVKSYRPSGNWKEGWHLNFPEYFNLQFLYRYDFDDRGNCYRSSAARAPISADTTYELVWERKTTYSKDSIVTFQSMIGESCWNLRTVYDANGKFRRESHIPESGDCQDKILLDSLSYKSDARTYMRVQAHFDRVLEIRMRNDEQVEKIWEISRKGKRTLHVSYRFGKNGKCEMARVYHSGKRTGTITYTYNEMDLVSEIRSIDRGDTVTTRYSYTFFQ